MGAIEGLPPPRPVIWPLRSIDTAQVEISDEGVRRITIRHAELKGVTPEMLAWWYANVVGEMEYAGELYPRYLVWHPLDHISYSIVGKPDGAKVSPGTRLHIREAFQRDLNNLLDLDVTVERLDTEEAAIAHYVLGVRVMRLSNRFEATATGCRYTSVMTIGVKSWLGHLAINYLLRQMILPGDKAMAWVRHHIEEVGNLENFLPDLYK